MFHGEAVAIGIHMAAVMSQKLGWIDNHFVDRIVQLLKFYNVRRSTTLVTVYLFCFLHLAWTLASCYTSKFNPNPIVYVASN